MAKGISLHIGLNSVDPNHYGGWSGDLAGCENDANDMAALAKGTGYSTNKLLTKSATAAAVIKEVKAAAATLSAGDIFFLSYSGHGGQMPDTNGDEPDGLDETWVLYDRQLLDDEIYNLWSAFAGGVRIIVLSDSCHSGTVTRFAAYASANKGVMPRYRVMPKPIQEAVWRDHQALYTQIGFDLPFMPERAPVGASVLLISGCQDWQLSADGNANGLFTGTLKTVWNSGSFNGTYVDFHEKIWKRMPSDQKPNYFKVGTPSAAFEAQRPFSV